MSQPTLTLCPPPTVAGDTHGSAGGASAAYAWSVVAMLWCVCFLNYADRQAISSILPRLHDEFGFDKVQQGLIASAFMWVYAAAAPLAGYIGDRVRRKDLILGGCLFWSFVTVATAWCGRLWQFVLVRGAEGFGETFYFPASMSLVSDYHGPRTRSRAMSLHQSSVYAGTVAGSWLAGWFAQTRGWRSGFYLFGVAGMVLALVLYRSLREPRRGQVDGAFARPMPIAETARAIFRRPVVPLLMLAFLGANFVATIFLAWTPTFLVEKFHFRLATAGLSGAAFIHVASAVSVPFGGMLADRLARQFAGGRILVQAAGLSAGAAFVSIVGATTEVRTLLAAMTLFGLCKGLYDSNIFAALYDAIEPAARSSAAGLMNTVGWGGGALGPLFVGWVARHGRYGSEVQNMSHAIMWTGSVYVACASVLIVAAILSGRWKVA